MGNFFENLQSNTTLNGSGISNLQQTFNNIFNSSSGSSKDFAGIVSLIITSILKPVMLLMVSAAAVYFMYGVLTYVRRGEDEGDRAKGISMMWYGIVAIFVMISVWGLVYILINTFNLDTSAPPIPKLQ